ncbi:conserved hypothetical protein, partial [Ricinus communis]
ALARDGTKFNANTGRALAIEFKARVASGYRPTDENVHNSVQEAFRLVPLLIDSPIAHHPGISSLIQFLEDAEC